LIKRRKQRVIKKMILKKRERGKRASGKWQGRLGGLGTAKKGFRKGLPSADKVNNILGGPPHLWGVLQLWGVKF